MIAENISAIKKKPSISNQDNRKDVLRASQEMSRAHSLQAQSYKLLEKTLFAKRAPSALLTQEVT